MRRDLCAVSVMVGLIIMPAMVGRVASASPSTPPGGASSGQAPAIPEPPATISPEFPVDPDFKETGDLDADRPFFNDYSWRAFIALNWPAEPNGRGVPHPTREFGDTSVPVVWGTWKSLDELFPLDPIRSPPTEWGNYDATLDVRWLDVEDKVRRYSLERLLPDKDAGRRKLLQQVTRLTPLSSFLLAGNPRGPLIAQNRSYVRFEVRVNRMAYDFVRNNGYYIKANLPNSDGAGAVAEFPEGTVHTKAAWMELPNDEATRKRFYRVEADVVDWDLAGTPVLRTKTMGLVGFHIVSKTPKRKSWIWSTFEHIDNLAPTPGGHPASFSVSVPPKPFGTDGPTPPPGNFVVGKPLPDLDPVEVMRRDPIDDATKELNRRYRSHRSVKDTVWKNYQLVGTQWPVLSRPARFEAANRHPQFLANTTIETYVQKRSCILCHALAFRCEFVFYPEARAYSPPVAGGGAGGR